MLIRWWSCIQQLQSKQLVKNYPITVSFLPINFGSFMPNTIFWRLRSIFVFSLKNQQFSIVIISVRRYTSWSHFMFPCHTLYIYKSRFKIWTDESCHWVHTIYGMRNMRQSMTWLTRRRVASKVWDQPAHLPEQMCRLISSLATQYLWSQGYLLTPKQSLWKGYLGVKSDLRIYW